MGRLSLDEIKIGMVSHLDQAILSNDPKVLDTYPQQSTELRPFVCVAKADDGTSTWAPLTSTKRPERVEIVADWRVGGLPMWVDRPCYLNDGANVYIARPASIMAASHQEKTDRKTRSIMSQEGVNAVLAEIEKQRHRRVNGHDS
jgi:hypothetical protein